VASLAASAMKCPSAARPSVQHTWWSRAQRCLTPRAFLHSTEAECVVLRGRRHASDGSHQSTICFYRFFYAFCRAHSNITSITISKQAIQQAHTSLHISWMVEQCADRTANRASVLIRTCCIYYDIQADQRDSDTCVYNVVIDYLQCFASLRSQLQFRMFALTLIPEPSTVYLYRST